MMEINLFWKTLRQFFTVYLPKQRNCSTNTIEACHKTWNMLIRYITDEKKISLASISFEIFDPELIISFLDYMENKNHWKPATRNQRLICIRIYFKYDDRSILKIKVWENIAPVFVLLELCQ